MLVPAGAQYHFGCLFDAVTVAPNSTGWPDLVRSVRAWIARRYSDPALSGRWVFTGGEWRLPGVLRVLVKTQMAVGSGSQDTPQYWAIRYEHPCEDVAARQWRTDIGITVVEPNRYRFSLTTIHWLLAGYIGEEPKAPEPTAPAIVRALLESPRWQAWAGSERLHAEASPLNVGDGEALRMRLEDPARQCAIILITREHDTDLLKLNPTRLAKLLAGNASVVAATSTGVDRELEYILPRGFSCWNGAVRVYQPKLRFGVEADSRRHRYFIREQIDGLTADAVEAMIVRGIARSSRTRTTFGVGSVEDVVVRQRESRLQELRQNTPDTSLQEKLKTYDDLIGLVDEENKALSSQLATLKQELEDAEAERAEIETNIPTLQYERDHLRRENISLEARVRSLIQQRELVQGLQKLPESLLDVIELIAGIWSDRIVFTDRAKLSAKRASLNKAHGEIPKAWGCVWAMATALHGLLFAEEQGKGTVLERFRAATGFELTFTEGKQTKQDKKFMRLRRDVFQGSEIDITPHVKYGSTPPRCLRVHFCALHDKKIIVVGHCGDHLDTYGTQWL